MTFRWQARGVPTVTTWALRWRRSEGGGWVEVARVVQLPPRRPMWHAGLVRGDWSDGWPETLGHFPDPRAARVHTLRWVAEQLAEQAAQALAPRRPGRRTALDSWDEMTERARQGLLDVPRDDTHLATAWGWQATRRVRSR